jgi:hypothetical protein
VKLLPFKGNPPKYFHADALAGIRAEPTGDPQELVAFDFYDRGSRSMFCTVAEVTFAFIAEWRVITSVIGGLTGTRGLHSEPPRE